MSTNFNFNDAVMSSFEFATKMMENGVKICIPSYNGTELPMLQFFYTNEQDLLNGQQFVQNLMMATKGDYVQMCKYMMEVSTIMTNGADEKIEYNNKIYYISYKNKLMYDNNGEVVVKLEDCEEEEMSDGLIKKMLMMLLKNKN